MGQALSVRDSSGVLYVGTLSGFAETPIETLLLQDEETGRVQSIPMSSVSAAMSGRRTTFAGRGFLLGLAGDVALFITIVNNLPVW